MAQKKALDLSHIDPPVWSLFHEGKIYGPYTMGQLKLFIDEERVNETTSLRPAHMRRYMPAGKFPEIAHLFADKHEKDTQRATEDAEAAIAAAPVETNFMIVIQGEEDALAPIYAVLNSVGQFAQLPGNVFLLRAKIDLSDLQTRLAAYLDDTTQILMLNAATGRMAWLNMGPDMDQMIRTIWKT